MHFYAQLFKKIKNIQKGKNKKVFQLLHKDFNFMITEFKIGVLI